MPSKMRTLPRTFAMVSAAFLLAAAAACGDHDQRGSSRPSASASAASTWARPPSLREHRTTDGIDAVNGLSGQIEALEAMVSQGDPRGRRRADLIDRLSARAEYAGRIADLERAAELGEGLAEDVPEEADSFVVRAGTRAALHRFDEAEDDLREAQRLGAHPSRLRGTRVSILQARGEVEEALRVLHDGRVAALDVRARGTKAVLLGELGRVDEAERAFRDALAGYRDTSPFALAWLFFQEGLLWEREGQRDRARAHYEAACERVPTYAHAAAHLAPLLPPDGAVALLRPLLASADDPEVALMLAEALQKRGDRAESEQLVEGVRRSYDSLVTRQPEAFADHAAAFWLDFGKDPRRALVLARINLGVRRTPRAYELAVLAAIAAGDRAAACSLGTDGISLPAASSMLRGIVTDACSAR